MGFYFGKEGIRGIANEFLTGEIAYKCGNALATTTNSPLILIGKDTRLSGDMLTLAFASGAISGGATVYDLGIIPTAGVAYLTKQLNANYGIVISASHNPPEYNGIKLFGSDGYPVSSDFEHQLELMMNSYNYVKNDKIGKYVQKFQLGDLYASDMVRNCVDGLYQTKVVIDCANGSTCKIAPNVFGSLGADAVSINTKKDGLSINVNCGSLHTEQIAQTVIDTNSNAGFALDGDGDRVIAIDERGKVVDGDKLLYMLAVYYKQQGKLDNNIVVGTTHTNMAIQRELEKEGIKLVRANIGARYVIELMKKVGAVIGCEQSGHIVLRNQSTCADGLLASVVICKIMEKTGKTLSELTDVKLYPQTNINIPVKDRLLILNSEDLAIKVEEIKSSLQGKGRIVIRASETEEVIRVFAETEDKKHSDIIAKQLADYIKQLSI